MGWFSDDTSPEEKAFKKQFESISNQPQKRVKISNDRYVWRNVVTESNIGSVFFLLGQKKYPDFNAFQQCGNTAQKLAYSHSYNGWLAAPRLNMLKVVHFISILNNQFEELDLSNNYMASKQINQAQMRELAKKLYVNCGRYRGDYFNFSDVEHLFFDSSWSPEIDMVNKLLEDAKQRPGALLKMETTEFGSADSDYTMRLYEFNDQFDAIYNHCHSKNTINTRTMELQIEALIPGFFELGTPYLTIPDGIVTNIMQRLYIISTVQSYYEKIQTVDTTAPNLTKEQRILLRKYIQGFSHLLLVSAYATIPADGTCAFILMNQEGYFYSFPCNDAPEKFPRLTDATNYLGRHLS